MSQNWAVLLLPVLDPLPIGAEGHRPDRFLLIHRHAERLSRRGIRGAAQTFASGHDSPAVGAEGRAVERDRVQRHPGRLPRCNIPEAVTRQTFLPSGLKATTQTEDPCRMGVPIGTPVVAFQSSAGAL